MIYEILQERGAIGEENPIFYAKSKRILYFLLRKSRKYGILYTRNQSGNMPGGLKEREEDKMRKEEIKTVIESIYKDACKESYIAPDKDWATEQEMFIERERTAAILTEAERACRKIANAVDLGAWLDRNMMKWADEIAEAMA